MQIQGKHVLVTGAAKRLGRAIAEHFAGRGANVTAHYHRSEAQARSLSQAYPNVQTLSANLTDAHARESLVRAAVAKHGPVEILVPCASDFYSTAALECTPDKWDALMDINLKSIFFLTQACLKTLKNQNGVVLFLCDIYVSHPLPRYCAYSASKGGLWTLTRTLAAELAPNVRVNSISPGSVLAPESFTEEQKKVWAEQTLFGRWGEAADIVNAVDFLVRNDYITGFDLKVDGGASLIPRASSPND